MRRNFYLAVARAGGYARALQAAYRPHRRHGVSRTVKRENAERLPFTVPDS